MHLYIISSLTSVQLHVKTCPFGFFRVSCGVTQGLATTNATTTLGASRVLAALLVVIVTNNQ